MRRDCVERETREGYCVLHTAYYTSPGHEVSQRRRTEGHRRQLKLVPSIRRKARRHVSHLFALRAAGERHIHSSAMHGPAPRNGHDTHTHT